MEQRLRIPLKKGQQLHLIPADGQGDGAQWEIIALVGEGGSSLCYEARSGMKSGRLKEFYPVDAVIPLFTRLPDGRLRQKSAAAEKHCGAFLRAYETLEETKRADPAAEVLNNFLPPYLLLRGEAQGTVYVWTPDDKQGITFERYLQDVWKAPQKAPEHKLYNILNAVVTLTDCIRSLHRAGLLHMDIKPSNFLVLYDGNFNINPGSISLFDVNTLCLAGSGAQAVGSMGFCPPEVPRGRADNRSDLYAIGAMLFRALTDELYRKEYYSRLSDCVAASALIQASQTNANVFLRHTLSRILEKCLAFRPGDRYACCEELLADLKRARTFLLPEVAGAELGWQKKLAILDTEPQAHCSPAAVMHDLLFRDPPDTHLSPGEDTIRVLVVGAGTYGQKFIDICLQACLMPGKKLHITALSQDPQLDREVYFQIRPALPQFLDQDDIRLDFAHLKFGQESTAQELEQLLERHQDAPFHSIFVSLGDDARNMEAAALLAKGAARCKMKCSVHFVVQSMACTACRYGNPVHINAPIRADSIDPRLKQMAWNTHRVWAEGTDADEKALRRSFRRKYNLEASLSYALCVDTKLRSVGIDEKDPRKAAAEFERKVLAGPDEQLRRLAALEHRRWVLEKVTSGWQQPRDSQGNPDLESGIARGDMKDSVKKTHPCIVLCTEAAPLRQFTKTQWDTPGAWDEGLDPLDQLSLRQHRLCLGAAQQLRESRPLYQGELPLMRRRLAGAPDAVIRAFEEMTLCLTGVLKGSFRAAREFDRHEAVLRRTFPLLSPALRREMTKRLDQVRVDFFPAVESCLYRDYKRQNVLLTRQIPFILTGDAGHCRDGQRWEEDSLPFEEETAAYDPKPLDTSDICLPPALLALTEELAANIHDVWARERVREGWTYGERRDDEAKTTPCLVPYEQLPDSEKAYDRNTALQTLKLIAKLGWRMDAPEDEKQHNKKEGL